MNPRVASALEFFETLVKAMALRPNDLHVITTESIGAVDMVIRCNAADTARLIGKGGSMADGLRVIGHAIFGNLDTQFRLEDIVDNGDPKEPFTDFHNASNWDSYPTVLLLKSLLLRIGWTFDGVHAEEHNQWTFKVWVVVTPETARRMRDEIVSAINAIFIVIGTRAGKKVFVRFQERGQGRTISRRDAGVSGPVREPSQRPASGRPDALRGQRGMRL
ncbi:MAG: KH domain-containing protein [Desulfurellales bacterium]|nr:MAG: KH domain-containing protein [Desulfurellales bacterium]